MAATDKGEWKAIRKALQRAGCDIVRNNQNHECVRYNGQFVTMLQYSRSDSRAVKNVKARIRRAGIAI